MKEVIFVYQGGMDYNLTPKTYGYIEYHFSSAGKKNLSPI